MRRCASRIATISLLLFTIFYYFCRIWRSIVMIIGNKSIQKESSTARGAKNDAGSGGGSETKERWYFLRCKDTRITFGGITLLLSVIAVIAFIGSTSFFISSAFPAFETKSSTIKFGDISGLNSSEIIAIDGNVSTIELSLFPHEPTSYNLEVNILTSSTWPLLSSTTLKSRINIFVPLQGQFRAGCNILLYDEPIYLRPKSSLKYEITSSNYEVMNQLCYFNNSHDYTKFLNNYTFEYDSKFCFNISESTTTIIDININKTSLIYVAIDTGGNTSISVNITIVRSYYNIKMVQDLSSHCSLTKRFNSSCIIKICDEYLTVCKPNKKRYVIIESSDHIMLKYDTIVTFRFQPMFRFIFFSFGMFLEIIAIIIAVIAATMICKWKKNGHETKPKCAWKGIIAAVIMVTLFVMCLHLVAIAFMTNNINNSWSVSSNNTGIGNKYPVLLNSQAIKSVSNVEITLPFATANAVFVYKVPCKSLKTSSKKLGPISISHMIVSENSRTGFNFNNYSIPLNLARGSTITYNIGISSKIFTTTLPSKSGITCICLIFMNSIKAYEEFLNIPYTTNFTSYIFRSNCLVSGNNYVNFAVKDEQNDYYVGIETNININVSAEVSVVQVYYDLSNTEVYTNLSVYKPSCSVRVCETFLCVDRHDTCILVDSTDFDIISYAGVYHKFLATTGSTSHVFNLLAIICILVLILLAVCVCFCYCKEEKKIICSSFRNMLSNNNKRKSCIIISIFIGIVIFIGTISVIIFSNPLNFSGKAWINNTKDFVLIDLKHKGYKWDASYDVSFSVETDSNSTDIGLYTVHCSEVVPEHHALINKNKIECHNFTSSCVLNEFIYLVKTQQDYVNYSISLSSTISGLSFRVSIFDDYEQYENFLAKRPYTPLSQSTLFTDNETFNFIFSHDYMIQKAAYYHFVLHPAFRTDVYIEFSPQNYSTSSSVKMESNISYYSLPDNRPQCNITKDSTSICTIKDDICVIARANMLTAPVFLNATATKQKNFVPVFILVTVSVIASVIFIIVLVAVYRLNLKVTNSVYSPLPGHFSHADDYLSDAKEDKQPYLPPKKLEDSGSNSNLIVKSVSTEDLKIRGVQILQQTLFEFTGNKETSFTWKEYGISIFVPAGVIKDQEKCQITIRAISKGEFNFPESSDVVSGVYWIHSSHQLFLKPVKVTIDHCATLESIDDCNQMQFIIARCNQKELPYNFSTKDGSFLPDTHEGSVSLHSFSFIAAIRNYIWSNDASANYLVYFFVQQRNEKTWFYDIVVIKAIPTLKQEVKEEYKEWSDDIPVCQIKLIDKSLIIELNDANITSNNWEIRKKNTNEINREDMQPFNKHAHRLAFKWIGEDDPEDLCDSEVVLNGAKGNPSFTLNILMKQNRDCSEQGQSDIQQSQIFQPTVNIITQNAD